MADDRRPAGRRRWSQLFALDDCVWGDRGDFRRSGLTPPPRRPWPRLAIALALLCGILLAAGLVWILQ
jgi:hypothetical protein